MVHLLRAGTPGPQTRARGLLPALGAFGSCCTFGELGSRLTAAQGTCAADVRLYMFSMNSTAIAADS
jgi:hypothetical protein